MPDTNVKELTESALDANLGSQSADRISQYKLLLGDKIVKEISQTLGEEGTKKFLDLHAKFDTLLDQHPELDIINVIPVDDIGEYSSFTEYVAFLRKIYSKLNATANSANNKADKSSALNQIVDVLSDMLGLADQSGDIATASSSSAVFVEKVFAPLVAVPLTPREKAILPKTYPDYVEIARYVHSRAEQAEFNTWLLNKLNGIVKRGLERLAEQKNIMEDTRDTLGPKDYLVELQKYLMDNKWIGYSKSEVKEAIAATKEITRAGYTTNVEIAKGKQVIQLDIDALKSHAYLFLGVTLDAELRKAIYRLADSVNKNYNIEGGQPGMDVLMAASAVYIQDFARQWLTKLIKVFNDIDFDVEKTSKKP